MSEYKKGAAIVFTGGRYIGLTGWFNDAGSTTEKMYSVIVKKKDDKLAITRVMKTSVELAVEHAKEPSTYTEAILKQMPDINQTLSKVCDMLAECKVGKQDYEHLMAAFVYKLEASKEKQQSKGFKAKYRRVAFNKTKSMDFIKLEKGVGINKN